MFFFIQLRVLRFLLSILPLQIVQLILEVLNYTFHVEYIRSMFFYFSTVIVNLFAGLILEPTIFILKLFLLLIQLFLQVTDSVLEFVDLIVILPNNVFLLIFQILDLYLIFLILFVYSLQLFLQALNLETFCLVIILLFYKIL